MPVREYSCSLSQAISAVFFTFTDIIHVVYHRLLQVPYGTRVVG